MSCFVTLKSLIDYSSESYAQNTLSTDLHFLACIWICFSYSRKWSSFRRLFHVHLLGDPYNCITTKSSGSLCTALLFSRSYSNKNSSILAVSEDGWIRSPVHRAMCACPERMASSMVVRWYRSSTWRVFGPQGRRPSVHAPEMAKPVLIKSKYLKPLQIWEHQGRHSPATHARQFAHLYDT